MGTGYTQLALDRVHQAFTVIHGQISEQTMNQPLNKSYQWIFLVPLKGGRDSITPQQATYKWYISGIYCQLGDYMPPTTF